MKYTLSVLFVGILVFTGASCSKGDTAADATIPSLSTTNTESVNTADNTNTQEATTNTNTTTPVNTAVNTGKTSGVTTNTSTAGLEEPASTATTYSAADIAKHATASDCWSAIDGKVYNISSYINQHPGGRVVTQACGKDGSQLFKTQGGRGQHSSTARAQLASFEIGTLK